MGPGNRMQKEREKKEGHNIRDGEPKRLECLFVSLVESEVYSYSY